jgi:hypothetical protein
MHIWSRKISRVLADKSGMETSVAELMVSTIVKVAVTGSLAAIIGGVTMFSAMANASTQNSSAYQTSDLQFAKAVHAADRVIGYDDDAVALLSKSGDACNIDLWHGVSDGDTVTLHEERRTDARACDLVSGISLAPGAKTTEKAAGLTSAAFTYENIGGRDITFDSSGTAALDTSKTQPSDIADSDWNDPRPYKVNLALKSDGSNLTAFAKNTVLTGYTKIVNATQAVSSPGSLRFVPSGTPVPAAVNVIDVSRSTTTGTIVGGVREGISVTFTGAQCSDNTPSTVVTKFSTTTPSGVPDVSSTQTLVLTGKATQFELAGVMNGAQGVVSITAVCGTDGESTKGSQPYTQTLPDPTVTATEQSPFSTHKVAWNKVSSLPTTFTGSWTGNDGTKGDIPATSALNAKVVHPAYSTYGVTNKYTVVADVSGITSDGSDSISRAWPTIPTAANFRQTEKSISPAQEALNWGYNTTCPTGTTLYTQYVEDRTGQANGSIDTTVRSTSGFKKNLNGYTWAPSYALQGYKYGIHVQTECVINSTGDASSVRSAVFDFQTGMNTPGKPTWASYNVNGYNNNAKNTHVTKSSSCTDSAAACGYWLIVTYNAYCPAGSVVVNTHFKSLGWPNEAPELRGPFEHTWGYQDYWQGTNQPEQVTYSEGWYSCQTPWGVKRSNVSGNDILTVNP